MMGTGRDADADGSGATWNIWGSLQRSPACRRNTSAAIGDRADFGVPCSSESTNTSANQFQGCFTITSANSSESGRTGQISWFLLLDLVDQAETADDLPHQLTQALQVSASTPHRLLELSPPQLHTETIWGYACGGSLLRTILYAHIMPWRKPP